MLEQSGKAEDLIANKKNYLKFAVIGHIEWINFIKVDYLPKPGIISHGKEFKELPAGGGAVITKTLSELTNNDVHFFTALGNDFYGKESYKFFEKIGINLHVAWRDKDTRKGFSLVDNEGDRSITVLGERLSPTLKDDLNWNLLEEMDGIFVTAGDKELLRKSRNAKILCTTPRVGLKILNDSKVKLDCLIGSNLDPDEKFSFSNLEIEPGLIIKTEGSDGGIAIPGGRFKAIPTNKLIDSYGCGDSFAAGILYGLASKWNIEKTLKLGTVLGRNCIEYFGPYPNMTKIKLNKL